MDAGGRLNDKAGYKEGILAREALGTVSYTHLDVYKRQDGYMKTGWQEYKGDWYYLNPDDGVMRVDCTIDGYRLDRSGKRI